MTNIVGRTIVKVGKLTKTLANQIGLEETGGESAITLDDGTILIALRDPEGNGPGHLVARTTDGHLYDV